MTDTQDDLAKAMLKGLQQLVTTTLAEGGTTEELSEQQRSEISDMIYEQVQEQIQSSIDDIIHDKMIEWLDENLAERMNDRITISFE